MLRACISGSRVPTVDEEDPLGRMAERTRSASSCWRRIDSSPAWLLGGALMGSWSENEGGEDGLSVVLRLL